MNNQALFVVLCNFCQRILDNDPKSGPNLQMDNHHHPRTTRITLDSLLRAKIKTMLKFFLKIEPLLILGTILPKGEGKGSKNAQKGDVH